MDLINEIKAKIPLTMNSMYEYFTDRVTCWNLNKYVDHKGHSRF